MSVAAVRARGRRAWKVRYRDHGGKEHSETYDLKPDADVRDAEIRRAKQNRQPIPTRGRGEAGQTFEQFARDDWWPQHVVGKRLAPKTREMYVILLDAHLVPLIGSESLAYIDVPRVLGVRTSLAASNVGDYTSARALKLMRQILAFAVEVGRIPHNPADVLRARGALPSQKRKTDIRPLDPDETEALRERLLARQSPNALRDATFVSVLAYAGLRPEEALALKWESVGEDYVHVVQANRDGELAATKTGGRRMVTGLIETLRDDLAEWREASPDTRPSALVFPSDDGGLWRLWDYANWRRRTFKPNAPANARPYDLRHGYGSLLIREGVNRAEIAEQMGNSVAVLDSHYLHVFTKYRGRPAESMGAAVAEARAAVA